ncbi:MAG: LON peptidase substrate-binding domain-containing protein [Armatimonadetes bacterium]|nr:LON peptidase substrate-binding domain-containing protein [Armatimonadota bacterium]MCA1998081.1 LON peptidase substrate-binding domain-containing protein [Armatimonadota bacterium]
MGGAFERMPLFVVDTVLFPYAPVQFRIFEERYLRVVRECGENGTPLGVALAREASASEGSPEPRLVGTRVRILHLFEVGDGRLEVHGLGEARFRIRRLEEDAPYPVALVEPLEDHDLEWTPRLYALSERARELCSEYVQTLFQDRAWMPEVRVALPQDAAQLSFTIANLMPLGNDVKQGLLECTDPTERLRVLVQFLERECDSVRDLRHLHRLSTGELSDWVKPN